MDVITPRSLDEAVRLKSELPDARFVQGGTDLLVELNFDRSRPPALINLNEVAELRGWSRRERDAGARCGPDLRGGDARAARRRRCPRSPRRRGRSDRRRSATGARSAAISARPRPPATRCRRCSSRARRSRWRACAARGRPARGVPGRPEAQRARAGRADRRLSASQPGGSRQTFMKVGPRNAMVIAVCSLALSVDRERGEIRAAYGSAGPVVALVTRAARRGRRVPGRRRGGLQPDRRPSRDRRLQTARAARPARRARSRGVSHEDRADASTASRARPTSGAARACSTRCASGSVCPARRTRASRASAARARCCSTACSSARASCSRRRPTVTRWSPWKASRRTAGCIGCRRRSSPPARFSAASARRGSSWRPQTS